MIRGHQYLVFGKNYEPPTIASVTALRQFSDLPVHVVTNIRKKNLSKSWAQFTNVTFSIVAVDTDNNRDVKTRLDQFTPFDETLYTDSDTLILSKEFMKAFELLQYCDVAFPAYSKKDSEQRLATPIYQEALALFKPQPPLLVYQGGVCSYNKNARSRSFFALWNRYWKASRFRDMPGLVCAVHNIKDVVIGILPDSMGFPSSKVIKHFYGWKPPVHASMPQFTKQAPNETTRRWEPRKCFR